VVTAHFPVRPWWSLGLVRGCSCGRVRPCLPPDLRVRDVVGDRLPDGDRVPWPGFDKRPAWAGEVTRELNVRPFLTLGQQFRSRGRRPA
jgi:hypothetical protein